MRELFLCARARLFADCKHALIYLRLPVSFIHHAVTRTFTPWSLVLYVLKNLGLNIVSQLKHLGFFVLKDFSPLTCLRRKCEMTQCAVQLKCMKGFCAKLAR